MDFERALETQRLRLLRLVAGLVVLVGVLSVGPVSRGLTVWTCQFIGSILSRAEAAARYLVIAHACRMNARSGLPVDARQISEARLHEFARGGADVSLIDCQGRLRALRAALMDLPRAARHLLRRIEKRARRAARSDRPSPCPDARLSASLCDWRMAGPRIERPPDHHM